MSLKLVICIVWVSGCLPAEFETISSNFATGIVLNYIFGHFQPAARGRSSTWWRHMLMNYRKWLNLDLTTLTQSSYLSSNLNTSPYKVTSCFNRKTKSDDITKVIINNFLAHTMHHIITIFTVFWISKPKQKP